MVETLNAATLSFGRCPSRARQRKLSARSDRVKAVDFHPTEPWVMTCLYNGNVYIWNYETQVRPPATPPGASRRPVRPLTFRSPALRLTLHPASRSW